MPTRPAGRRRLPALAPLRAGRRRARRDAGARAVRAGRLPCPFGRRWRRRATSWRAGWAGMLGADGAAPFGDGAGGQTPTLIAGTPRSFPAWAAWATSPRCRRSATEGFIDPAASPAAPLVARRKPRRRRPLRRVPSAASAAARAADRATVTGVPRAALRMLDHWDNLDGTIERGYAGWSLWDWHKLPGYVSPRITRLRARERVDRHQRRRADQRQRQRAGADRRVPPQGGGAGRRASPLGAAGLPHRALQRPDRARRAADRRSARRRASPPGGARRPTRSTRHIPDFGGFLVKANSEGQPGPQDYGRSHAEGANLLADALAPHGGAGHLARVRLPGRGRGGSGQAGLPRAGRRSTGRSATTSSCR